VNIKEGKVYTSKGKDKDKEERLQARSRNPSETQSCSQSRHLELTGPDLGRVVSDHLLNSLLNSPPGLPAQNLLGTGGVSPSLLGVITGQVLVDDVDPSLEGTLLLLDLLDDIPDSLGKLEDGELVGRSNVDGTRVGSVHQQDKTVDQVVDVLERSGLGTVTVNGHVLTLEGLDDEVGNNTTVVRVHPGSESAVGREKCERDEFHGLNVIKR
jgi:hypothetical protein